LSLVKMNSKSSVLKIGSVALLFTLSKVDSVSASMTNAEAQVDAEIQALSQSVQEALSQSDEGSEALADSEIQGLIEQ